MNDENASRRQFLVGSLSGLGTAWLASQWPAILAAQAHAQSVAGSGQAAKFQFFSPAEAAEIEALASQIIPDDDSPGAREAHVIFFIDRALTTFDQDKQPAYKQGLKDLQLKTHELFPTANLFSSLTPEQQIQLLTAIEKTDFFELVRLHTIMGFLANPEYGGNFDHAGWKLIGFEDRMVYQPPFGYYDAEYDNNNKER